MRHPALCTRVRGENALMRHVKPRKSSRSFDSENLLASESVFFPQDDRGVGRARESVFFAQDDRDVERRASG